MSKRVLSEAETYTGQYNNQAGQHRTVIYEHFPSLEGVRFKIVQNAQESTQRMFRWSGIWRFWWIFEIWPRDPKAHEETQILRTNEI